MKKRKKLKMIFFTLTILLLSIIWFIRFTQLNKNVAKEVIIESLQIPFQLETEFASYEIRNYELSEDLLEFQGGDAKENCYKVSVDMIISSHADEPIHLLRLVNAFELMNQGRGWGTVQEQVGDLETSFLQPKETRELTVAYHVWKNEDMEDKLELIAKPSTYVEEYRKAKANKKMIYKVLEIEVD